MGRPPSTEDSLTVSVRLPRAMYDALVREGHARGHDTGEAVAVSTIIRQCIRKHLLGAAPAPRNDSGGSNG